MRPIAALVALLLTAAACGARGDAPLAAPSASPSPTVSAERLAIAGERSTDVIDTSTGRVTATVPGGLLSPSLDLAVSVAREGTGTRVVGTSIAGAKVLDVALPGDYRLSDAYGAAPSGFSPNGKWLVLVSRDAGESRFAVVDVARSAVAKTVALSSRFSFDAIHNDASAMYLIEHPKPGATTYNVRLYDLAANLLKPDIIFDKAAIGQFDPTVGLMDGTFHVSVAPKSGDWSYGLYMRPNGAPFVHALNVPGRYAQCIVDLAGTWSPSSMFAMALTEDGNRLFVVDSVAGNVSLIDGLSQKVTRTARFRTKDLPGDPRSASAVVSRDGSRLYATAARGVAVLLTADLSLKSWLAADRAARSVALSSDGARLYALSADAVLVIDAASGRVLSEIPAPSDARSLHLLPRR